MYRNLILSSWYVQEPDSICKMNTLERCIGRRNSLDVLFVWTWVADALGALVCWFCIPISHAESNFVLVCGSWFLVLGSLLGRQSARQRAASGELVSGEFVPAFIRAHNSGCQNPPGFWLRWRLAFYVCAFNDPWSLYAKFS
jgi:hypothetical protein